MTEGSAPKRIVLHPPQGNPNGWQPCIGTPHCYWCVHFNAEFAAYVPESALREAEAKIVREMREWLRGKS